MLIYLLFKASIFMTLIMKWWIILNVVSAFTEMSMQFLVLRRFMWWTTFVNLSKLNHPCIFEWSQMGPSKWNLVFLEFCLQVFEALGFTCTHIVHKYTYFWNVNNWKRKVKSVSLPEDLKVTFPLVCLKDFFREMFPRFVIICYVNKWDIVIPY